MKAKRVSRVLCFMLVSVLLLTGIPVLRTEAATDAVQLYVANDGGTYQFVTFVSSDVLWASCACICRVIQYL